MLLGWIFARGMAGREMHAAPSMLLFTGRAHHPGRLRPLGISSRSFASSLVSHAASATKEPSVHDVERSNYSSSIES